jgi:protein BCP1
MSKRKPDDDDSDCDTTIDVSFDFFDPNPQTDYQSLLRLLRQLFQSDADAHQLALHALTDLVLAQPLVGTTIKTDGRESDPLAFLTVLNLSVHRVCVSCFSGLI